MAGNNSTRLHPQQQLVTRVIRREHDRFEPNPLRKRDPVKIRSPWNSSRSFLTTPELVKRWWGFDSGVWSACDIDLRVGGTWRYVVKEGDMEVGFHGVYREIDAPTRIVSTEAFEGLAAMGITDDPDQVASINTVTLEESDGVTTMNVLAEHVTQEHRDGHIASGMDGGMQVSYNRLEGLVSEAA